MNNQVVYGMYPETRMNVKEVVDDVISNHKSRICCQNEWENIFVFHIR